MGYAWKGDRAVRLLARSGEKSFSSSCLEDNHVVLDVEHMTRAECKMFEDGEKSMEELKNILVKSLFT
jgi:hypothetical protein